MAALIAHVSCWLPSALHAEKFTIFWCPDCQIAAPVAFIRDSILPETLEPIPITFDYC